MLLKTPPNLHIRRPSPTTIEYTVSTAPPPTLPNRLLDIALLVIRIILGASTLLILHGKWQVSRYSVPIATYSSQPPVLSMAFLSFLVSKVHYSPVGQLTTRLASLMSVYVLLPLAAVTAYMAVARVKTEESLLVLRGLGIQMSTSSSTFLTSATTRFIPSEQIADVLVNEAFRGFEVRYYLVVVVKGEKEIVVVFPKLLPRRAIVEQVWRGARRCLFEAEREANGKK